MDDTEPTPTADADDPDTGSLSVRLEHPSGLLHLFGPEGAPTVLDLPPGREFDESEFADHAGLTRQTVGTSVDLLLDPEHRHNDIRSPRARSSGSCTS